MFDDEPVNDVVIFLTVYLVFSLVPFLALNREILSEIQVLVSRDVVIVAVAGTGLFIVVSGLALAREGVERYNDFLAAPTDTLSLLVAFSFFLAALSWWLIPEVAFYFEWGVGLDVLLSIILACHVPMIIFLSLMTAVGKS